MAGKTAMGCLLGKSPLSQRPARLHKDQLPSRPVISPAHHIHAGNDPGPPVHTADELRSTGMTGLLRGVSRETVTCQIDLICTSQLMIVERTPATPNGQDRAGEEAGRARKEATVPLNSSPSAQSESATILDHPHTPLRTFRGGRAEAAVLVQPLPRVSAGRAAGQRARAPRLGPPRFRHVRRNFVQRFRRNLESTHLLITCDIVSQRPVAADRAAAAIGASGSEEPERSWTVK